MISISISVSLCRSFLKLLTLQQYSALTGPEHSLSNHYIYILFALQSYIEGYSDILGISTYLRLNLTMTQIELVIEGNFLNLIKAEVFLFASYSKKWIGAQFYVKVTVGLKAINNVSSVVMIIKVLRLATSYLLLKEQQMTYMGFEAWNFRPHRLKMYVQKP